MIWRRSQRMLKHQHHQHLQQLHFHRMSRTIRIAATARLMAKNALVSCNKISCSIFTVKLIKSEAFFAVFLFVVHSIVCIKLTSGKWKVFLQITHSFIHSSARSLVCFYLFDFYGLKRADNFWKICDFSFFWRFTFIFFLFLVLFLYLNLALWMKTKMMAKAL